MASGLLSSHTFSHSLKPRLQSDIFKLLYCLYSMCRAHGNTVSAAPSLFHCLGRKRKKCGGFFYKMNHQFTVKLAVTGQSSVYFKAIWMKTTSSK